MQPLLPLRIYCHCCRNLFHTLCLHLLLCLPPAQPLPAATAAPHCCCTAVISAIGPVLPLMPNCCPINCHCLHLRCCCCCHLAINHRHQPPIVTACHLTPAFVDCCIFNFSITLSSHWHEIFQCGCQRPSIILANELRCIFTVKIYRGTNCPPIQKIFFHSFCTCKSC
jgi:hypothetical protein